MGRRRGKNGEKDREGMWSGEPTCVQRRPSEVKTLKMIWKNSQEEEERGTKRMIIEQTHYHTSD